MPNYQTITSKPDLVPEKALPSTKRQVDPANSSGANGRAQQGNLPTTRQQGPVLSNKPQDTNPQIIIPSGGSNLITSVLSDVLGGPVPKESGFIWPRIDFSENLQTGLGTLAALQLLAASYVSFAVPNNLTNRKIYAYVNVVPLVNANFAAFVGTVQLSRKGKILTGFPLAIYNGAGANVAANQSLPFISGTGLAGYDSIGVSLRNLQGAETSPVSLVPLICSINIDKIHVDIDTVNSTATNISSLRVWIGCISY